MRFWTTKARHPLDRTARLTVALLFAAWSVDYLDRLVINLALPAIAGDFRLDHAQQGMVISAFFLAYALFQIPGGVLADRFGAKRIVSWALLAWSLFTALTGAVGTFLLLLVVRFAFGAAEGVFPGASMKALSERTSPEQRMTANGWMQSSNAFGALLTPLVGAPLIALWGWRGAFFALAFIGVVMFVIVRRSMPESLDTETRNVAEAPESGRGSAKIVLRSGVLWRFALMFFGYDLVMWGLGSWVPSYLQTERGLSIESAGLIGILPALLAGAMVILGGKLSDRLRGRHRLIVVPSMIGAAVCLPFLTGMRSLTGFVVVLTVATSIASVSYMPIFTVPLRTLPAELAGAAAGMIVFGGQAAGVVAPVVMGWLVDHFSFTAAFLFLMAGPALAVVLSIFTPQDGERFLAGFRGREESVAVSG